MRRIGKFHVTKDFVIGAERGEGVNLFHGMIVLQATHQWQYDRVEYYAWHADFDETHKGWVIPEYRAVFDGVSVHPVWVRK